MSELFSPEKIVKKIVIALVCVVAVVAVAIQLVRLVNSGLTTEKALAVTMEESVEMDGYIMRRETVLFADSGGTMLAAVKDGERISKDREAVRIYYTENDLSTENYIRETDEKISVLEKSSLDTSYISADLNKMDDEIAELLSETLVYTADNDLVGAISRKEDLLVKMNKRWLLSHPGKSFESKIEELMRERSAYRSRLTGSSTAIIAPASGYYYASVDGYESIFSSENIKDLSVEKLNSMINSQPEQYIGKSAGKIVTDHNWYIACPISTETARLFDVGNKYSIEFTYNYGTVLDMTLYSKTSDSKTDSAVLVFTTNTVPSDFEYTRNQKIKVIHKKYSGLKVPKQAIRFVDDIKGVYVISGAVLEFKRAEEIYSLDDYYIIEADADSPKYEKKYVRSRTVDEEGKETVTYYRSVFLYDTVVVDGKNLYDGMKIE